MRLPASSQGKRSSRASRTSLTRAVAPVPLVDAPLSTAADLQAGGVPAARRGTDCSRGRLCHRAGLEAPHSSGTSWLAAIAMTATLRFLRSLRLFQMRGTSDIRTIAKMT